MDGNNSKLYRSTGRTRLAARKEELDEEASKNILGLTFVVLQGLTLLSRILWIAELVEG